MTAKAPTVIIKKKRTLIKPIASENVEEKKKADERQAVKKIETGKSKNDNPSKSKTSNPPKKKKKTKKFVHNNKTRCYLWLVKSFPVFDPNDIKPLALSTRKTVFNTYFKDGGKEKLGFSISNIRMLLSKWVSNSQYLQALIEEGAMRYDVNNQPIGAVSKIHAEYAQQQIDKKAIEENN